MKRIATLVLAVMLLLTWTAGFAEPSGTQLDVDKIRVSLIGSDNKNVAKLHGIALTVAMGGVVGIPTFQVSLHYGEGQQLDSVVQIRDDQLVLCVGGISGTFCADLKDLLGEELAKLVSTAFGSAMMMFGSNPQLVLQMLMPMNEKGQHVKTFKIPAEQYMSYVQPVVSALIQTGAIPEDSCRSLLEDVAQSDSPVKLRVAYTPDKNRLRIRITRDGEGLYVRCRMAMTTGPMEFINISTDEEKYDLLNLDPSVIEELNTEVQFLGFKLDSFVENSNIRKLTGDAD